MSARQLVTPLSKRPGNKRKFKDTLTIPDIAVLELSPPNRKKVEATGIVLCWGTGDTGQLGLGENTLCRKKPAVVKGDLEGENVVTVVSGGMHSVALTEEGKVYTWGCNDEGALGRNANCMEDECVPGLVTQITEVVVSVCAGDSHTAVLTKEGHVYCWGWYRDNSGPLVDRDEAAPTEASKEPKWTAVCVMNNDEDPVVKIDSGVDHSVAVTSQGVVWSWGCAEQGQLGRIAKFMCVRGGRRGLDTILTPQIVRFDKRRCPGKVVAVFCGAYHTFVQTDKKEVFVFGLNNYGQCGTGSLEDSYVPTKLVWSKDTKIVQLDGGLHHTILLDDAGHVYTFGRGHYGRLGLGKQEEGEEDVMIPTQVEGIENISRVAAGGSVSFALDSTGKAWAWGMATNLQLSNGDEDEDAWTPIEVTGKQLEGATIHAVCCGGQHSVALITKQ